MITQPHYLIRIFSLVTLFIASLSGFASEKTCTETKEVLVRSGKHKYAFVEKELKDLYCNKTFEGKHFKVVYQKSNEPISFDDDPELVKRAANVYYHLSKARKFWIDEVKSDFVKDMDQLTVRVQITNSFSRLGHYTHDDHNPNHNNAWTIPAGETPRWAEHQEKWGKEIWFSPMKKIESRELVTSSGNNPLYDQLNALKRPVLNYTEGSLTQNMLNHLFYPTYQSTTLLETVLKHVGIIGITYGVVEVSKKMDKLFMQKYHYIDTAMIPEIIYHEFSHVALSDKLQPVHSVPVIEGMADYFATRIAKTEKMYRSIKNLSTNAHKNAGSKKLYHPYFEHENNASSDFTLSLLWLIKDEMHKVNKKRVKKGRRPVANVDELIYESRHNLDSQSTILELTMGLKRTCETSYEVCSSKRLGVGTLNEVFEDKGF